MKNKGFTLVELIAVIIIMGIVFVLTLVNVIGIIHRSTEKEYALLAELLEIDARLYIEENNPIELDIIGGTYCVTLEKLDESGLVKLPVVDPRDDNEFPLATCIMVEKLNDREYSYKFNEDL